MNKFCMLILGVVIALATTQAIAEDTFPQLEAFENPKEFTFEHGNGEKTELKPFDQFVVITAATREELKFAVKNPEMLNDLPEGDAKYVAVVPPSVIKDVADLKKLAAEGKLPIIHRGYQIKNTRAPLVLVPTSIIEVELKSAKDAAKLDALAKKLNLVEVKCSDDCTEEHRATYRSYELSGKSKYQFIFSVAAEIGKADFVDFARPVAPMINLGRPNERRAPEKI